MSKLLNYKVLCAAQRQIASRLRATYLKPGNLSFDPDDSKITKGRINRAIKSWQVDSMLLEILEGHGVVSAVSNSDRIIRFLPLLPTWIELSSSRVWISLNSKKLMRIKFRYNPI